MQVVAKACEITTTLGKKGVSGVLKSVASRQSFLSEPSHRIRFVYTPKHSSWLNQIEVVFGVIMRKVIRRGSFTSVKDLRDKLLGSSGVSGGWMAQSKPNSWCDMQLWQESSVSGPLGQVPAAKRVAAKARL